MEAAEAVKAPAVKAEVTSVTMTDGRIIAFAGKRKMLKETVIDGGKVSIRIDFRNGETRKFDLPDSLLLKFAGHGAEQKYGWPHRGIKSSVWVTNSGYAPAPNS